MIYKCFVRLILHVHPYALRSEPQCIGSGKKQCGLAFSLNREAIGILSCTIHADRLAIEHLTGKDLTSQLVADLPLNQAAQRAGTISLA